MRRARPDLGFEEQAYSCHLVRISRIRVSQVRRSSLPHATPPIVPDRLYRPRPRLDGQERRETMLAKMPLLRGVNLYLPHHVHAPS